MIAEGTDNKSGLKLRVSSTAYDSIVDESKRWNGVETGTVLVGTQDPDGFTITHVITPGANARRSLASFSPDVEHVNKELRKLREMYAVDYLGVQHLHHMDMSYPSIGDLRQAEAILKDKDYKIHGRFLSIIATRSGDDVKMFPYVITKEDMSFRKLDYDIVSEAPESLAKNSSASLSGIWSSGYIDKEKRIDREVQKIARITGVYPEIKIIKDNTLTVEVKGILFMLPPEYPLAPPRIFLKKMNKFNEIVVNEQFRWNSSFDLAELLNCRKLRRRFVFKKLSEGLLLLINLPLKLLYEKKAV